VRCIDIDVDGNLAVAGTADGVVFFIDIRKKSVVKSLHLHSDSINQIQFTPDGSRIITCSSDKLAKVIESGGSEIFSVNAGESLRSLKTNGEILLLGGDEGVLRIWNLKDGTEIKQLKHPSKKPITSIACSKNGDNVVTASVGTIYLFKPTNHNA